MEDLRKNGDKYASGGESRILRYASAVGVYDGDVDFNDGSDNGDFDANDQEIPIQQRDN
jgi:hypothetical protein